MRLPNLLSLVTLLVASTFASADSVVAASDLSAASFAGANLCPENQDCEELTQQFTVSTPVQIDEIKVVVTNGGLPFDGRGTFNLSLGSALGAGMEIGSGDASMGPPEKFDFTGLDISLPAGTYYLLMTGDDAGWSPAPTLTTSLGSLGPEWACDPTLFGCTTAFGWQTTRLIAAVEIDGTAITPEPSTLALFGTGLLVVVGEVRRRVA
jgi:hypothetical protein